MKKCLIIGAGQLGSRHLQGLLKQKETQSIFVVDPSNESLELSKQRAQEIQHLHELTWCTDISQVPAHIDLAIIATSANVRRKVVDQLLQQVKIEYLILEKVLFQKLEDYSFIQNLLKEKNQQCWVNHPRRMFNCYAFLQSEIQKTDGLITMKVEGNNWGLACNGLHLLDLFQFLSSESVSSISNQWVDVNCFQSKRQGFVEFYGTIKASTDSGQACVISSHEGDPTPLRLTISKGEKHWTVQEGATITVTSSHSEEHSFAMQYQSELSSILADEFFHEANCSLPVYDESDALHRQFIRAFLEIYNKGLETKTDILPIT